MRYEVIVPVYNGEAVIAACLKSITEQENAVPGEDYSVLVIDDGSTDRTVEIASGFPVKIISLGENRGRIVARMVGAQNARSERLLFVDSRVTIPPNLIESLAQFDSNPAVMGVDETGEEVSGSILERIFFLIRRKYYGRENYPVLEKDMIITPGNFKRSPKGTTLLLIDRDLFLRLIPERTGKGVSDDTLLLHNLVFREGVALLRTPRISLKYNPQRPFGTLLKWLYGRGTLFADFYFSKGGYYHKHFFLFSAFIVLSIVGFLILPAAYSLALLGSLLGIYLAACVYLSEAPGDVFVLAIGFPMVALVFGAGVLRFWMKSLLAASSK